LLAPGAWACVVTAAEAAADGEAAGGEELSPPPPQATTRIETSNAALAAALRRVHPFNISILPFPGEVSRLDAAIRVPFQFAGKGFRVPAMR
jgi:hypothetical protein